MTTQKINGLLQDVHHYGRERLEHRLTHQKQDEIYEEMIRLQMARDQVLDLLTVPQPLSPRLGQAVHIMLQRSDIYRRFAQREQAIQESLLSTSERTAQLNHLCTERDQQLENLSALPALSLQEQEQVLQELMRQAVELYVEQSLEQMKLHFHFEVA